MSELDIVQIPGYPGKWARRCVVEAWITAGRPYVNWAGRTYEEQKYLYNLWRQGRGNAADNPDANTRQPHVRGMALDLAGYDKARMEAAGFVQPIWRRTGFSQDEPWHWELARYVNSIRSIPKVTAGQVANLDSKPFIPEPKPETPVDEEEDDMPKNTGIFTQRANKKWFYLVFNYGSGIGHEYNSRTETPIKGAYNSGVAGAFDTPTWAQVSEGHYDAVKRSLERVLSVELSGTVDFE